MMLFNYLLSCMMFMKLSAAPDPGINHKIDVETNANVNSWITTGDFSEVEGLKPPVNCPHKEFKRKHVCLTCTDNDGALKHTIEKRKDDKIIFNTVFKGIDIDASPNKYDKATYYWATDKPTSCVIDKPVTTWKCNRKGNVVGGDWEKCVDMTPTVPTASAPASTVCSAHHDLGKDTGHLYVESIGCWSGDCPNFNFTANHLCETCTTDASALDFVKKRYGNPIKHDEYQIVEVLKSSSASSGFTNTDSGFTLLCENNVSVKTWLCYTLTTGVWDKCVEKDTKCKVKSRLDDGFLFKELLKCDEV